LPEIALAFLSARRRAACARPSDVALTLAAILATGALVPACGGGGGEVGGSAAPAVTSAPVLDAEPADSKPAVPADCTVTLEGDSILYGAYGHNLRLDEPPAAALQRMRPAYTVVDNSAPGSTAAQRAPVFSGLALTTRFVVLQHGLNDGQFGRPYERPLRDMLSHVRAQGRTPVITGISRQTSPALNRDMVDAIARGVAESTGTLFADWDAVPFKPDEMADVLHPAPAYSQRLVARLAAVLDQAAPECKS
jgi:hypothetical protein